MNVIDRLSHPAFSTAVGTVFGYVLVLLVMFTLLFLVPYVFFTVF